MHSDKEGLMRAVPSMGNFLRHGCDDVDEYAMAGILVNRGPRRANVVSMSWACYSCRESFYDKKHKQTHRHLPS